MADQSVMCNNYMCPKQKKCYRYMAIPEPYQQYKTFHPDEKQVCLSFIEIIPLPTNYN